MLLSDYYYGGVFMSVNSVSSSLYTAINNYLNKEKANSASSTSDTKDTSKVDTYKASDVLSAIYSSESMSLINYLNYDAKGSYSSDNIYDSLTAEQASSLEDLLGASSESIDETSSLEDLLGTSDLSELLDSESSNSSEDSSNMFDNLISSITDEITTKNNLLISQAVKRVIDN